MSALEDHRNAARVDRWPPLLAALRRTVRPDRARVTAYASLARRPGAWADYGGFLARHRTWLASLDGALAAYLPGFAAAHAGAVEAGGATPRSDRSGEAATSSGAPWGARSDRSGEAATSSGAPWGAVAPARTRAEALGYLYVREAFRLGAEALSRALGVRGHGPAEYPDGEVPARRAWRELADALWSVADPQEQAEVLEGARSAYAAWERRLAPSLARLGLLEEPGSALQAL